VVRDYLDERTASLAVKPIVGAAFFYLSDGTEVEVPYSDVATTTYNLVPLLPPTANRQEALARARSLEPELTRRGLTPVAFYRGPSNAVIPTMLNPQTLPRVWSTFERALEAERAGYRATSETGVHLLLWYIGARFPVRTTRGSVDPAPVRSTGVVLENAATVGKRLFDEVSGLAGTGLQRFLEFARRLSFVRGLSPDGKASLLLEYAARFGLDVGSRVAMPGGRILLIAKDARTALQIAADGTITFGRFSTKTLDIVNPVAIRPLAP
jgi:hypothetical protein